MQFREASRDHKSIGRLRQRLVLQGVPRDHRHPQCLEAILHLGITEMEGVVLGDGHWQWLSLGVLCQSAREHGLDRFWTWRWRCHQPLKDPHLQMLISDRCPLPQANIQLIEFVGWTATARCRLREGGPGRLAKGAGHAAGGTRTVWFAGAGAVDAALYDFETMEIGVEHVGPAIVESPFTTVVADAETRFERTASGSLVMRP